jgi:alpha-tubulin suppressor-like RCC1 family protein
MSGGGQTAGGSVIAWGDNTYEETDVPSGLSNVINISAGGYHGIALQLGGEVTAWGDNNHGQDNLPSTSFKGIAASLYASLLLKSNGIVSAYGDLAYGLINIPISASNVTAVAGGWYHGLALRSNGTVVGWGAGTTTGGFPNFGQSIVPTNLAGVMTVAAGGFHSLALQTNGTVVAWGWNASGQTNVPPELSNVVAIAAGGSNSIALKSDGTLLAWGDDTYGESDVPAGLSNVVAISAGAAHVMALKSDGTVVAWGLDNSGQTDIPAGLTNVAAISAGGYFNLALVNTGPVTFLNSPYSQTIFQGGNATFAPAFLGTPPLNYQWLQNGTNILNATNASLIISNAPLAAAGNYQLVVNNSYGAVTSKVAMLTVIPTAPLLPPVTNQWVLRDSNATLSASVAGLPPFTYQWLFDDESIPGATNSTLTVSNVQPTNDGIYSLTVTNAYGGNAGPIVSLTVVDLATALGPTNLVWRNPSQPGWFPESTNTLDGFAAALGPVTNGQVAILQTEATGPGTLKFSTETSQFMQLSFLMDGVLLQEIQSPFSWLKSTFYLPAGMHALSWTTPGDLTPLSSGMAFLDEVSYTPSPTPVFITALSSSQTNSAGNNVTLSVGAAGTPPILYQWYFNGVSISGATSSSLIIDNIQASNSGAYSMTVSDAYGTALSSNAVLDVIPAAPSMVIQPASTTLMVGGQTTFSGSAVGSSPITYQWLFNDSPIPGATAPSLTVNNVQSANGGAYALIASNLLGSAVSSNAVLLTYTSADLAAALNSPSIVWSITNVPWFPETNTTYDGVSAVQSGVIANSQESTLQGVVTGPATITYWWAVSCDSFWDSLAFSVNGTIENSITGTVGWQEATNYIGSGSQTLQWNLYPVYGAFAGGTGWVDQVQILPGATGPNVTANPGSATKNAGANASFSVSAIGTPLLLYQWQFDGTSLPGATNASLSLNNIQASNAGTYSVTVSNAWGSTASSNAVLVVNPSAPVITTQPLTQSAVLNGSATFTMAVTGSSAFSYQWIFNGAPIPGATTSTLALANLQSTNSGSYDVIVSNGYGTVTSSIAMLVATPTVVMEFWTLGEPSPAAPLGLSNIMAVAAGAEHSLGLRQDGTVAAWGDNTYGQTDLPAGLSNVIAIAAGDYDSVALKSDGTVITWGDNTYGQQFVPAGLSNVTAIATSAYDIFALLGNGTVVGWGDNINGQLNIPLDLTNVQAIAAGAYNGFAIRADGSVVQWGNGPTWQENGTNTQLTLAPGLSNVTQIAAGGYSAWALQENGTVLSSGWASGFMEISNVVALAGNGDDSLLNDYALVLTSDGTIVQSGILDFPLNIPVGLSNVVAVSAGSGHALALLNNGTPFVARPLLNQTVYSGATAMFCTGITGSEPLSYQWQFGGLDIAGATSSILVLTNVALSASGNYDCIAINSFGAVTNLNATLTVLSFTPEFSSEVSYSNDGFSWQLNQLSGQGPIIIQTSTNLVDWVSIFTNPPVNGSLQFLDSGATNQPYRYYRAIEQ